MELTRQAESAFPNGSTSASHSSLNLHLHDLRVDESLIKSSSPFGQQISQINRNFISELRSNLFQRQTFGLRIEEVHDRCSKKRDNDEDQVVLPADIVERNRRAHGVDQAECEQSGDAKAGALSTD